jgi:UDP-2,3-diacylglucosamine pyrophosphatase LpxH
MTRGRDMVKTTQRRKWRKAIVIGDVHIPYHDVAVTNLVYDFMEDMRPDLIIIIGDYADCYEISKFAKDKTRGVSFSDEARIVRANLQYIRKVCPNAKIVYVCGNHEHRLHRFLMNQAPELEGLPGVELDIPGVFGFKDLKIEWVPCNAERFHDTYWQFEDYEILFGHFARVCKHSGYTAKNLIDDYGISLIQGHVHSMGFHERSHERGYVGGWENGCLCDLNPMYMKQKNWMHGFHIVWFETPGKYFDVQEVKIINGQFRYGTDLWRVG